MSRVYYTVCDGCGHDDRGMDKTDDSKRYRGALLTYFKTQNDQSVEMCKVYQSLCSGCFEKLMVGFDMVLQCVPKTCEYTPRVDIDW